MNISFNCCPRPSLFKQNGYNPLFKSAEPAVKNEVKATSKQTPNNEDAVKTAPKTEEVKLAPQPKKDTVEVSKKPVCEGPDCKK